MKKSPTFFKSQISNLKSSLPRSTVLYSLCITLFLFLVPLSIFAQSPFGGPPQNPQDPGGPTNPGGYTAPGNSATLNNPTNPGNPTNTGPSATLDNPTNPGAVTEAGTGLSSGTGLDSGAGLNAGVGLDAGGGVGTGSIAPVGAGLLPTGQNAGGAIGVSEPNDPGYVLYGGNGGQAQDFWAYLKGLFSLKGQDNQSTYKNQETEVIKYTEGTTPPAELPKTLATSVSDTLTCNKDTSTLTLNGYINLATCVLVYLIPIIIAAMVLWFMFGAIKVMNDNEHESRDQYKQFLVWGVVILFVALCFVGILRLLSTTIGV